MINIPQVPHQLPNPRFHTTSLTTYRLREAMRVGRGVGGQGLLTRLVT